MVQRLVTALALAAMFAVTPASATDGTVLLTVTGDIAQSNRGPFDAFHDGFLNFHGMTFEKGYAFNGAALDKLPQHETRTDAEPWPASLRLSGPLLADVLAAAGGDGKPVTLYALDGFGARMTTEQIAARPWVLATHANGEALAIGGRGPLWLVYDTGAGKATAEDEAAWVWSVFHIKVGE